MRLIRARLHPLVFHGDLQTRFVCHGIFTSVHSRTRISETFSGPGRSSPSGTELLTAVGAFRVIYASWWCISPRQLSISQFVLVTYNTVITIHCSTCIYTQRIVSGRDEISRKIIIFQLSLKRRSLPFTFALRR